MVFNPGALDTPIVISTVTVTADGLGAEVQTYTALTNGPKWAQYLPLRGAEKIQAGQLTDGSEFKLRIRRNTSVNETCRVSVRSQTCEITGVEDNGRAGDMVLHCRKVVA